MIGARAGLQCSYDCTVHPNDRLFRHQKIQSRAEYKGLLSVRYLVEMQCEISSRLTREPNFPPVLSAVLPPAFAAAFVDVRLAPEGMKNAPPS